MRLGISYNKHFIERIVQSTDRGAAEGRDHLVLGDFTKRGIARAD